MTPQASLAKKQLHGTSVVLLSYFTHIAVNNGDHFFLLFSEKPQFLWLFYNHLEIVSAHQKLGHVKSQILDKAESMLSQWSHSTQTGVSVQGGLGDTSADWTQGDQHHLATVMGYKKIQRGTQTKRVKREKTRETEGGDGRQRICPYTVVLKVFHNTITIK